MAFARVINEPKQGVGAKTIEKLRTLASVRGESILETVSDPEVADGLSAKSREAVKQMTQVMDLCRRGKGKICAYQIYSTACS